MLADEVYEHEKRLVGVWVGVGREAFSAFGRSKMVLLGGKTRPLFFSQPRRVVEV